MWIAMDVRFLLAFRFRRSRRSVGTLQKHTTAAIAYSSTADPAWLLRPLSGRGFAGLGPGPRAAADEGLRAVRPAARDRVLGRTSTSSARVY